MPSAVSAAAGANDIGPAVNTQVYTAIRKASEASGTPFDLMMASAKLESGFQADAQSGASSASGLFQFTQQTWLSAVRQHGAEHGMAQEAAAIVDRGGHLTTADAAMRKRILALRNDPTTSAALAGDYMRDLSSSLSSSLGRPAAPGEIYLAHFLGIGGAKQMLTASPGRSAANVAPAAAQANGTMFYAKDGTPFTVSQFLQRVEGKLKQAVNDVSPLIAGGSMLADGNITNPAASGTSASSATKVAANSPAPPDAETSGWGVATPTVLRSLSESQVMASLVSAFTHPEQSDPASRSHRNGLGPEMPPSVLAALQMSEPAG